MLRRKKAEPVEFDLEVFIDSYIEGYKSAKLSRHPFSKIKANPVLQKLVGNYNSKENRDKVKIFEEGLKDKSIDAESALEIAIRKEDSFESGLCMGSIIEDEDLEKISMITKASEEFKKGFNDGQIYRLKLNEKIKTIDPKSYFILGGLLALCTNYPTIELSLGVDLQTVYEHAEKLKDFMPPTVMNTDLQKAGIGIGIAGLIYGHRALSSGKKKLMSNDQNISRELYTDGAFRYHRNPWYASNLLSISAITLPMLTHTWTGTPNIPAVLTEIALLGVFYYNNLQAAKRDEKVLEKTFGQEYLDYKATTPRFMPSFKKIGQDIYSGIKNLLTKTEK